jgi:hypothetical protein
MRGLAGRKTVASLLLALALGATAVCARSTTLEYQVKASYLYNFLQFITWPVDAFGKDNRFNLCVVGAERFGAALDEIAGERADGREIAVRRLDRSAQARAARCHLLFIAAHEPGAATAEVIGERGLLTVGETPRFLQRGGVINLVKIDGRIRFEVNQQAARQAGLVVSSRILSLAVNRP